MDVRANNILAAIMIENETKKIQEQQVSQISIDKSKLPASCFLWIEDPKKKSTWHLPYREGIGGINPETGTYRQAGAVDIKALRAVSQVISGARTGKPMSIPTQIGIKIKRLLKKYKIEQQVGSMKQTNQNMVITEYSIPIFDGASLDEANCILKGMAILRETSSNCSYSKGKGRSYTLQARESVAKLINGKKAYIDHQTKDAIEATSGVRSLNDFIGIYENGRVDRNGITRADLKYMQTQTIKEWIEALYNINATGVGGSIVGAGISVFDPETKMEIVEDIHDLRSTDLVSETGSTINLKESETIDEGEGNEEDFMEYKEITLQILRESRPDLVQSIIETNEKTHKRKEEIVALEEKLKTSIEENKKFKVEIDGYKLKEQLAEKEKEISKELEESKLKKEYISDVFKESLRTAKDKEARKKLIEDRKKIVEKSKKAGVSGMGDESNLDESKDQEKVNKEYLELVG